VRAREENVFGDIDAALDRAVAYVAAPSAHSA